MCYIVSCTSLFDATRWDGSSNSSSSCPCMYAGSQARTISPPTVRSSQSCHQRHCFCISMTQWSIMVLQLGGLPNHGPAVCEGVQQCGMVECGRCLNETCCTARPRAFRTVQLQENWLLSMYSINPYSCKRISRAQPHVISSALRLPIISGQNTATAGLSPIMLNCILEVRLACQGFLRHLQ